jgi:sigma-B regulation protein RsbU (phosphoserine phosphatase)
MFKILVIEDTLMLRRLLKKSLQIQGFDVIEAEDGESGLKLAEWIRPTLIIADLHLPGMDGVEVCRQIKENPAIASSFFILITADHSPEKQELAREAGADAFLSKPLKVEELGARLQSWMRLHGLKGWMQSRQEFREEQQMAQALRFQQQILEAELQEAADYVRSLLPKPCEAPIAVDFQFLPSKYLGGDCFDYYWLNDDQFVVYLLDVSGHGLGSALFSVSVQSVLRSQSLPNVSFDQPDQVLRALNERFQADDQNVRYFTMWYGVYCVSTRELVYASAGHPPALLRSVKADQPVQYLKAPGKPVGLLPESRFKNSYHTVSEPSVLYLFSDGVYEFSLENGRTWRIEDFVQLATGDRATLSTEQIIQKIRAKIGGGEFEDDCSLMRVQLG